jgi:hypothetical protein
MPGSHVSALLGVAAAALALALAHPVTATPEVDYMDGVHAAFYLWYGNPANDGRYQHWDHEVLPHWTPAIRDKYGHTLALPPPRAAPRPWGCTWRIMCFGHVSRARARRGGVVVLHALGVCSRMG